MKGSKSYPSSAMPGSRPASLWSRKRDLTYFIFFVIHVPIIFMVDTVPLFPSAWRFNFTNQIRDFYVTTYRDKFFVDPQPVWFKTFIWMELLYHAPLSVWAVKALWNDDPLVPAHLLVFGVQSFVTSAACLAEVWSWTDRTVAEKQNITMLYGPYVALGAYIAIDMFGRLCRQLLGKAKSE